MMYVLDTNVVSELRKVRLCKAAAGMTAWGQSVDAADLFVSAITIMELALGVSSIERKDATQGAMLRSWLEQHMLPEFSDRPLPVDTAAARRPAACARQARRARCTHRGNGPCAWHDGGPPQCGRFQIHRRDRPQPLEWLISFPNRSCTRSADSTNVWQTTPANCTDDSGMEWAQH